jgi:hypothetical protein
MKFKRRENYLNTLDFQKKQNKKLPKIFYLAQNESNQN